MKKTIGSVSALIALSAATASAEIRAAPFSDIGLDVSYDYGVYLDMDSDGTNNFHVYRNGGMDILQAYYAGYYGDGVVVEDPSTEFTKRFDRGAQIAPSEVTSDTSHFTNFIGAGVSYAGVKLLVGGETNWGWIELYVPNSSTGWIVRGAWETVPNTAVTTGVWAADVIPSRGPSTGGNTVIITNSYLGAVTNVTVGGARAAILDTGDNWVKIRVPAMGSTGAKDILIQTEIDDLLLPAAYTAGRVAGICDFDGDGVTDLGLYRPTDSTWHVFQSSAGERAPFRYGQTGDLRIPADYDGDGLCDLAVFRPSYMTWYIFGTATGGRVPFRYGAPGDFPAPADYDGDGKADIAVVRPSTMTWIIQGSASGPLAPFVFGGRGDWPIPADYDGDGLADAAVFRPSTATWFIYGTTRGAFAPVSFGGPGDVPVPGDYDGDGKADFAVFRPSTAAWFIFGSTAGPFPPITYGARYDVPLVFRHP